MKNITLEKIVTQKLLIRILLAMLVITSLLMGFFHSAYSLEKKKYLKIEDLFVRVRNVLGRDVTQNLIDQSYKL